MEVVTADRERAVMRKVWRIILTFGFLLLSAQVDKHNIAFAALALRLISLLENGFYQQALYAQDWVCLARAGHPSISEQLTCADYRRELHVSISYGTGSMLLEAALVREGIEPRVIVRLPGFLGLPAIVSSTNLLATLPRNLVETLAASSDLQLHPCPIISAGSR